ncbi:hypothetical protein AGABI1DRAFT_131396 [Agaricus bisporus var. burnettii JB137-S8]|uniref:Uncharacterized protein n=1 Tax=Agaricus bisporus var. burnettii (strain JB137-S8 / ATCC MYA-4627 / FGSC 10392) TaxID=597362 RepID=K5VPA8_AGABU|nr:uncharacterized protein AGABI1DRAFT_131396 [Agaricus bisporus var. burnettii JB137-S8]EKM76304.1 hypothetical protein AGABI1DRAFT_131396 [Agaricus bisporus var. burnettii JB137-S8]
MALLPPSKDLRPRLASRHCQLCDSFATETYSDPTIADNQDAIIILHSKSATPRRFFRGGVAVRPAPRASSSYPCLPIWEQTRRLCLCIYMILFFFFFSFSCSSVSLFASALEAGFLMLSPEPQDA